MPRFATLAVLVAAASLIGLPAFAHPYPQTATPPVNSTVTLTPSEVTITFTESVEPRFSSIEVTGANAQRVEDGKPHLVDGDGKRLVVGLKSLLPGTYTVEWRATSVDSHKTNGRYHFTVAATDASEISVEHVWARASAGKATTGATYLTVTDNGRPDSLVGASTPIAATAELHETINDNGVMKMRPVPALALQPGKPVTFMPGGFHIMLTGLKGPLKAGGSFPLTLTFEHSQPITVTANVEAVGGAGMDHGTMPGMPGMSGQMGNKP